jgi:hypothetical protein
VNLLVSHQTCYDDKVIEGEISILAKRASKLISVPFPVDILAYHPKISKKTFLVMEHPPLLLSASAIVVEMHR